FLSINETAVSRLAKEAHERKLLSVEISCQLLPDEREKLETELFGETTRLFQKLQKLSSCLKNLTIGVSSYEDPLGDNDKWEDALISFGENIAPKILHLLHKCRLVGFAWGRTLLCVLEGIRKAKPEMRLERDVIT